MGSFEPPIIGCMPLLGEEGLSEGVSSGALAKGEASAHAEGI